LQFQISNDSFKVNLVLNIYARLKTKYASKLFSLNRDRVDLYFVCTFHNIARKYIHSFRLPFFLNKWLRLIKLHIYHEKLLVSYSYYINSLILAAMV
jgi:hypothetical protein